MVNLLILAFINALLIFGFYEATTYEKKTRGIDKNRSNILGWFAYKGDKLLPKYLTKPLWGCVICMSSVHSTYVYWGYNFLFAEVSWKTLIVYPAFILVLAGINNILDTYIYGSDAV